MASFRVSKVIAICRLNPKGNERVSKSKRIHVASRLSRMHAYTEKALRRGCSLVYSPDTPVR